MTSTATRDRKFDLYAHPATAGQFQLIRTILDELAELSPEARADWAQYLNDARFVHHTFDFSEASNAIVSIKATKSELRKAGKKAHGRPSDPCLFQSVLVVPAGAYAVVTEDGAANELAFYHVDALDNGYRVGHQVSSMVTNLPAAQGKAVFEKIAVDPFAAAQAYGRELGFCGRCGRPLTNDESRAFGIGPVCRSKF